MRIYKDNIHFQDIKYLDLAERLHKHYYRNEDEMCRILDEGVLERIFVFEVEEEDG